MKQKNKKIDNLFANREQMLSKLQSKIDKLILEFGSLNTEFLKDLRVVICTCELFNTEIILLWHEYKQDYIRIIQDIKTNKGVKNE